MPRCCPLRKRCRTTNFTTKRRKSSKRFRRSATLFWKSGCFARATDGVLLTKSRRSLKSNYGKVKKETGKSPDGGRCHECFVRRRHTCDYIGSNKRNLGAHDFGNHLHRRGFLRNASCLGFLRLGVFSAPRRRACGKGQRIFRRGNSKSDELQQTGRFAKIRKALEKDISRVICSWTTVG